MKNKEKRTNNNNLMTDKQAAFAYGFLIGIILGATLLAPVVKIT